MAQLKENLCLVLSGSVISKAPTGQIIDLGEKLQPLKHKLRPDSYEQYVFAMPWISLGEKQLIFQVWEVANHWNARVKRFMKKLGSLPSLTDEISLLYVSPKSNCLRKMAQNSRLWCQHKLWIETLQRFFCCPRIQHDTLPRRPASTSRNEILWLGEAGGWGNAAWFEN